MIEGHTITLVIPCRNEAAGLRALLPTMPPDIDEVIVVDNNSTDDTAMVAQHHGARVITETVPGYGAAYHAGFAAVTTDLIATLDGDNQYPVQEIPHLVKQLLIHRLDFISGCRLPISSQAMPWVRKIGNYVLTAATQLLFLKRIKDTQSGMWVFHRHLLDQLHLTETGMAFSEELKLKVIMAGLAFAETTIPYYPRQGQSKLLPFSDGYRNLLYLFRLRFQTLLMKRSYREYRTLAGLLLIGLGALTPSLVIERAEVRDDLRRADIAYLKRALEDFYNQHNFYANNLAELNQDKGPAYRYVVTSTVNRHAQGYYLETNLERRQPETRGFDEDEKRKYHFRILRDHHTTLYRVCGGTELQCQPTE